MSAYDPKRTLADELDKQTSLGDSLVIQRARAM
jgi:hypothetical protein